MNTRALNQTQPRRGIDHGSRYRGAPDQKHMGLADLLRKGPRLIEFFDHELGPKHSCDHVLNRQTGTGFLNDPSFYHQLVDQEIPSREPSLPLIHGFELRDKSLDCNLQGEAASRHCPVSNNLAFPTSSSKSYTGQLCNRYACSQKLNS
jgi:hypothetical protein